MPLLLRVFTHPACSNCGAVVRMMWEIYEERKQMFDFKTVKLENKEGLKEAHAEKIKTIPTVILSDNGKEVFRIVGTPKKQHVLELKNYLNN